MKKTKKEYIKLDVDFADRTNINRLLKIIETKRTYLRELTIEDASSFFELNEDEEILRYTGDKPFKNVQAAREFLAGYNQYKKYGLGRWAVIHKKEHVF